MYIRLVFVLAYTETCLCILVKPLPAGALRGWPAVACALLHRSYVLDELVWELGLTNPAVLKAVDRLAIERSRRLIFEAELESHQALAQALSSASVLPNVRAG